MIIYHRLGDTSVIKRLKVDVFIDIIIIVPEIINQDSRTIKIINFFGVITVLKVKNPCCLRNPIARFENFRTILK